MTDTEVFGRVKWFDATKGYGFLVSEDLEGDILVHYSLLTPHCRRSVPQGAKLGVHVTRVGRGLQATKVLSIDLSEAAPPEPARPSSKSTRQPHGEAGPFEPLEVKWFDQVRGYGFLMRGDEDVFVHAEAVRAAGLRDQFAGGEWFEARVAHGAKGLIAVELRAAAAEPQAIAA